MFEELFAKKTIVPERLAEYGFVSVGGEYRYNCRIMHGGFLLEVIFDRHGNPDTALTECDTGEEYTLYKTDAQGVYIGQVRKAIEDVLGDIAEKCFESSVFRFAQTLQLVEHAREHYGSEPEFLWKDSENGILRRRDTGKWYAAILTVPKSKLGFDSSRKVEIVNLHADPNMVRGLLEQPNFYPAWHMNKKSWFTVILDGSIDNDTLFFLLAQSYRSVKK
ncbi:MAG: MmcQ/YjbR family DNA-binding protein [Eubacteriales bacterium]